MVIKRLNNFYGFYIFFVIQLFFGAIIPLQAMNSGIDLETLEEVEEETKTIEEDMALKLIKAIENHDLIAVKEALVSRDKICLGYFKLYTPITAAILQKCSHDIIQALYESGIENVCTKKYPNSTHDLLAFCLKFPCSFDASRSPSVSFNSYSWAIEESGCAERIALLLKLGELPPKGFTNTLVEQWRCSLRNIDAESVSGVIQKRFANQNCGVVFDMLMRGQDRGIRDRAIDVFKSLEQEEQLVLKPYISFDNDYKAMLALIGGSYSFTGLSGSIVSEIAEFLVDKRAIDSNIRPASRADNRVEERRLLGRPSANLLASIALIKGCDND